MNILIILPSLSYRGGERIFYTLAKGLVSTGHRVKIIATRKEKDAFPIKHPIKLVSPSPFLNQLMQGKFFYLFFNLPLTFFMIWKNSEEVDIINCESGFSLWASVLVGEIKKIKVVWTIFAFEQAPFNNYFLDRLFNLSFRRLDAFWAKRANAFTCIAPRVKRVVESLYGLKGIEVIIPAIDLDRFENPSPGRIVKKYNLKGKKVLFLPASLHPKKNQILAIKALAKVVKVFPETVLILAGDGPDREKLKLEVQSRGLSAAGRKSQVIFTGVIKGDQMADFYAVSDLVLVASKTENEGLSLTALEALICGKLPIITNQAGVAEIAKIEKIGLVANLTTDSFTRAILSYLRHPQRYEKMIKRGRKWVLKELSIKRFTEKTLRVFKK